MRSRSVRWCGIAAIVILVGLPLSGLSQVQLNWEDILNTGDFFGGWPANGPVSPDEAGREAALTATFPAGGAEVTFSLSNGSMLDENGDGTRDYPRIEDDRNFGSSEAPTALFIQKTVSPTRSDDVNCVIQFSHPGGVKHLQFVIYDVDRNSSRLPLTEWIDRVVVTGVAANGTLVAPTLQVLGGSFNATVDGNIAEGMGAADDLTTSSADGANVQVDFGNDHVTSVTVSYRLGADHAGYAADYPNGNMGIGIGSLSFQPLGQVSGVVFADLNRSGSRDGDEPGLPGVSVGITDGDGVTRVVETDGNGEYNATVSPGTAQVRVIGSDPDIPPGSTLTGVNPQSVTVLPLQTASPQPTGYYYPNGTVSGTVFVDSVLNGSIDPGETGVAGVSVALTWAGDDGTFGTADDVVYPSTSTDGDGVYSFTGLPEGAYRVAFNSSTLPPQYVPGLVASPLSVLLTPGEDRMDVNFGVAAIDLELSDGTLLYDVNRPGLLDAGDTVSFELSIRNPSAVAPYSLDARVAFPDGLSGLTILSSDQGDVSGSSSQELVDNGIVLAPGETASILFSGVVCIAAPNNAMLTLTATGDGNHDGVADLSDTGVAGPVTKTTASEAIDSGFCTQLYTIQTVAGTGTAGYSGEGGPATNAELNNAYQACVDGENNLYVADRSNQVIRKIDAGTGIITTVAGTPGVRGYSGDGGPATAATLGLPSDVCVVGTNLYFTEMGNNSVRKVDLLTGIISTVAGNGTQGYLGDGGPATDAQLNSPRSLAVDVAGNIYIADTFNFAIRRVDASTGLIETIAGTGAPGQTPDGALAHGSPLEWVMDVALTTGCDGESTLWFTEQAGYNEVRRIVGGRLETMAGRNGSDALGDCGPATQAGMNRPYGIAFDTRGNLYVADMGNNEIRMVSIETGLITTIAGTGTAGYDGDGAAGILSQLNGPTGVAVGADDILYIVDSGNQRIRAMDLKTGDSIATPTLPAPSSGEIDTIAGTGTAGYNGDGPNPAVRQLAYPGRIAVDSTGNIYIADRSNHRIRKISTSWNITTIAGTGLRGYTGDGGPAVDAQLNFPTDLAVASDGTVYFSDQYNQVVRKIDTTGAISTVAGTGTAGFNGDGDALSAQLNYPDGLALDGDTLYISDWMNNRVRALTLSTGMLATVAGDGTKGRGGEDVAATTTPLDTPQGLCIDPVTHAVYIAERGNHRVRCLATATGLISTVAGTGYPGYSGDGGQALYAQLNRPMDVVVDGAGALLIAEYGNHVIRKVDASGIVSTVAGVGQTAGYSGDGGPSTSALLNSPFGVALDGKGDLLISDRLNHAVRIVGN